MGRGLTMEEAGELIVVNGSGVDRATWHGWERGRRIPSDGFMYEIERVTGVPPNAFYDRPTAQERVIVPESGKNQMALY